MKDFQLQLDLAFGCIASDGEVAAVELDCLKSICIQRGVAAEDYHASLQKTQQKFQQDMTSLYDAVVSELGEMRNDFDRNWTSWKSSSSLWSRMGWLTKGNCLFCALSSWTGQVGMPTP